MSLYDTAQAFLAIRHQVRQARQQQELARVQLQQARAALGQAFSHAADEVVSNESHPDDRPLAGLSSFALVEGDTVITLVFCDGCLQSVLESPILQPPSSP